MLRSEVRYATAPKNLACHQLEQVSFHCIPVGQGSKFPLRPKKISASKKLLSCQFFVPTGSSQLISIMHPLSSNLLSRKKSRIGVLLGPVSIQSVLCNVRVGSAAQLRQKCSSTESAHKGISKRVHNIWGWPPIRKKCLHFFILGIRRPIFLHLLTGFFFSKSAQFWLPKKRTLDARN